MMRTNEDRGETGRILVVDTYLTLINDDPNIELEDAITDAIADILHFAVLSGLVVGDILNNARSHVVCELQDEDMCDSEVPEKLKLIEKGLTADEAVERYGMFEHGVHGLCPD